ncbi:MAG TPA: ribosome-associated translation inhibitor RaiA [Thermohalobaculum sp.]|nr:ribosome-associated translation inhibitor RaiA [Thermohalobaculum sp.]
MQIKVSGKQIDVGDALRTHVEGNLNAAVGKYFDRSVDANVVFSRNGHAYKCDASVHLATGLTAQARAEADEIYAAFEQATDRIEKQLRRYKRRIKDHHQSRQDPIEMFEAQAYVLQSQDDDEETGEANGVQPVIIAEMTTGISSLTVGDAVMQMELAHAPFLLFRNSANGRINVVFQRDDGNVGWIDPANLPEN